MSCVRDGKCLDTSMGLTPLEGLIMGTRCGSIDPAIVPFVMEKKKLSPAEMDTLMNKKSGLLGLCGFTDMRDVHKEVDNGNKRAELALNMLVRSIKKTLGSYFFLLEGKVDSIVFTAGIGENDDIVREAVCKGLEEFGIRLNLAENSTRRPGARTISTPDSRVKVLVIPTNEELQIAQATLGDRGPLAFLLLSLSRKALLQQGLLTLGTRYLRVIWGEGEPLRRRWRVPLPPQAPHPLPSALYLGKRQGRGSPRRQAAFTGTMLVAPRCNLGYHLPHIHIYPCRSGPMPTPILEKESLIPGRTSKLVLHAPQIARYARPGHFVMLRMNPDGERIPLTIADTDPEKGTIVIVYLVMARARPCWKISRPGTASSTSAGRSASPPTSRRKATVVCVCGGTGIAAMHHIAKGHWRAGNRVVGVIGARTKDLLLLKMSFPALPMNCSSPPMTAATATRAL